MQEDAPSCRHSHHEAKNSVLCPRFLLPDGNPLPVLFLLSCVRNVPFCDIFRCRFSSFRSLASFSFSLLSVPFCFCPSSVFSSFSFFFLGKNEEGKVTFAFLFLFVCSPEEGKESVLLFLSSSRKGERECVLSFCFMIKGKEKRTLSVLFSSSASDKRQERKAFIPFFLFLFKEGIRPLVRLCSEMGRKVHRCFLFLFFFLLSVRKRQTIPAYGRWRSLLFSFRFQEKKRRER